MSEPGEVPILDPSELAVHLDQQWSHLSNRGGVSHYSYVGEEPDHRLDRSFEKFAGVFEKRQYNRTGRYRRGRETSVHSSCSGQAETD